MSGPYLGVSYERSNPNAKRSVCLVNGQVARNSPEYVSISASSLLGTNAKSLTFPGHWGEAMIRQMPFKLSRILSIDAAVFKDLQISSPRISRCATNCRASFTEDIAPGFVRSIVSSGCCSFTSGLAGGRVWQW
jgi:hypothetical protein